VLTKQNASRSGAELARRLFLPLPPLKSAKLIRGAKVRVYPGAPHGLTAKHQDQVNVDLLAFLRARSSAPAALASPVDEGERPAAGYVSPMCVSAQAAGD
jgi:hypothetical protein